MSSRSRGPSSCGGGRLELQACHPRFFATHRYILYAKLVAVEPRGGAPYAVALAAGS